ncbi:ABC transporter ATP-binding protein [Pelistega europaea]|uniref:ABC transporter ATP-binding protein n=1 Tax=Pelistega europaea TaxID=106147 RepID=A0A7Y4LBV0_9BURK|nr:ABC transporter ATP-binding protein [Pelistega europaea]NOL49686.1 ABC transporter ATP-binding protein [Pelistega europaea]
MLLQLNDVKLGYPQGNGFKTIIEAFSMHLARGENACLLGSSGCGKTTILRAIAGFEPLYGGEILLDGDIIAKTGYMVPPEQRHIGMMFQDYALFPHLTVAQNIAFGLHHLPKAQIKQTTHEMLTLIGLPGYAKSYPHELSGGQQQRVALARAIAPEPKLLLLDEPFSNLDVDTREKLATEVCDILKDKQLSAILVTHNRAEADVFAKQIYHIGEI